MTKSRAIELLNTERKLLDSKITKEALDQIETLSESHSSSTVVYRPDWHKGVIGIVASRLIEKYYRPTVVFTKSGKTYVGSVRSVKGFDVYKVLSSCSEHIVQYGGHKFAAGLTLDPSKYSDFKIAFEKEVSKSILPEQKQPIITYEIETTLDKITSSSFRIIDQMKPFGPLNRHPVFCIKNCIDSGGSKLVGDKNDHLRLEIIDDSKTSFSGIGFEMGKYISETPTYPSSWLGWSGFVGFYSVANDLSPLGNASADECADYCISLFSDYTRKVTMQNLFHDGGFSTTGVGQEIIEDF